MVAHARHRRRDRGGAAARRDSPHRERLLAGLPGGGGARAQLRYLVHARLTLFVSGMPAAVRLGVGIAPPRAITRTSNGSFVTSGSCFSFLHTRASDGIIHIEAPGRLTFKLGQFFDV